MLENVDQSRVYQLNRISEFLLTTVVTDVSRCFRYNIICLQNCKENTSFMNFKKKVKIKNSTN